MPNSLPACLTDRVDDVFNLLLMGWTTMLGVFAEHRLKERRLQVQRDVDTLGQNLAGEGSDDLQADKADSSKGSSGSGRLRSSRQLCLLSCSATPPPMSIAVSDENGSPVLITPASITAVGKAVVSTEPNLYSRSGRET